MDAKTDRETRTAPRFQRHDGLTEGTNQRGISGKDEPIDTPRQTFDNLKAAIDAVAEARHRVKLALDGQPFDNQLGEHLAAAYDHVEDCRDVLGRAWTLDEVYALVKQFGGP